jgi:hypothetical protein
MTPSLTHSGQLSSYSQVASRACLLVQSLQFIVDQLLDIRPEWEGDHRVTELIDARRLSELTSQLCAAMGLGLDF